MRQILLATDLDDTLIGDDKALLYLNEYLINLRVKGKLKLAYVTGRSLHKFKLLQNDKNLLNPDALVTAVGTEIYINEQLLPGWPQTEFWDRQEIVNRLERLTKLTKQPESEQQPYKVSYFLKEADIVDEIKLQLHDLNIDVLYSHNLYLDILPKDINKGSALKYLAKTWDIPVSEVIACGDSANDIEMLSIGKSVIVRNAREELLSWVAAKNSSDIYIARGNYSVGILEGLRYFQKNF